MGTKKQTSLKINEEHIQFEEIVLEIFKEAGYEITAEVIPIMLAVSVITTGSVWVVKETSLPYIVPTVLFAYART